MSIVPEGHNLFVVDIEYTVPFEQVEPHIAPHMEFVQKAYADGLFLASGAKVPRTGGIVIAMAPSEQELEARLAKDPFATEGIATMTITEFKANNLAEALK